MATLTLSDLQRYGFQVTPEGKLFLPYSATDAYRNGLQQDESGRYYVAPNARDLEHDPYAENTYYNSLNDYFNSLPVNNANTPTVDTQYGNALEGMQLSPGQYSKGDYNGSQGYFINPNQLSGAQKFGEAGGSGFNEFRDDFVKPAVSSYFLAQGLGGLTGGGAGGATDYGAGEGNYAAYEQAGGNAAYGVGSGTGATVGTGAATGTGATSGTGATAGSGTGTTATSGGGLSTENILKAGGLIASLAAGGQKQSMGTTTTTSSGVNAPWEAQQPYLQAMFQQASGLYGQPRSPESLDALRMMSERARAGTSLTEAGQREFGKTIAGDYLRPESNPYLQSTLNNLYGDVQSRVAGTFGTKGGNNYGSSAHQEWLGRALTEAASPILNQNYQTERGRQLNAAQLAPSMAYADIAPLQQVGAAKEAYPWDQLAKYQGAVSGNYGGTSNSQTTSPYFQANPYLNALGAGLATYGLGKNFGLWGAGNTNTTPTTTGGSYGSYGGTGLNTSGTSGWGYGWGTT